VLSRMGVFTHTGGSDTAGGRVAVGASVGSGVAVGALVAVGGWMAASGSALGGVGLDGALGAIHTAPPVPLSAQAAHTRVVSP